VSLLKDINTMMLFTYIIGLIIFLSILFIVARSYLGIGKKSFDESLNNQAKM